MEPLVHEMLNFYQRTLNEGNNPGSAYLERNGLLDGNLIETVGMGYASGKLAEIAGEHQKAGFRRLGLMNRFGEHFKDSLVLPVFDKQGELCDLYGLRLRSTDTRAVFWKEQPQGILGVSALDEYAEIVFCEYPVYWLHCVKQGFRNAIASRDEKESLKIADLLHKHGVKTVHYAGSKQRNALFPKFKELGIVVNPISCGARGSRPDVDALRALKLPERRGALTLSKETETHLVFQAGDTAYRVERAVVFQPARNSQVRVERDGRNIIDRADFTSSQSRTRFAKLAASRLQSPVSTIEEHLADIADAIDRLHLERIEANGKPADEDISEKDQKEAERIAGTKDLLAWQSSILTDALGYAGEDSAKRLCLLVAASRLLDAPAGAVIRGPSGCGKSALLTAVAKLLPDSQCHVFSRLTPQALYFLPRDELNHRLLVVDEYEGIEQAEYALRTLMSSQTLSLASTVKDGGGLPVTKTLSFPARLAVLVSTTQRMNPENLSRFVEIGLDASPTQNARVLESMAAAHESETTVRLARHVNRLLRPCSVRVPFASRIALPVGGSVAVRRRFAQLLALVKAHAALHQYQREREKSEDRLIITATEDDYRAVLPLLSSMIDHTEESLSPSALALLRAIREREAKSVTREDVMNVMNWNYSRAYRALRELAVMELVRPDCEKNGVLRTYDVAELANVGAAEPFPLPSWTPDPQRRERRRERNRITKNKDFSVQAKTKENGLSLKSDVSNVAKPAVSEPAETVPESVHTLNG